MLVVSQYISCFTNFEPVICNDVWGADDIWLLFVHFTYSAFDECVYIIKTEVIFHLKKRILLKMGSQKLSLALDQAYLERPP